MVSFFQCYSLEKEKEQKWQEEKTQLENYYSQIQKRQESELLKSRELINKLEQEEKNHQEKIQTLQTKNSELTTKNKKLFEELSQFEAKKDHELTEKSKEITNLKTKIREHENTTLQFYDKFIELTNGLGEKNNKISELKNNLAMKTKQVETLEQDKENIQKELDDTLNILNKPTKEMGTQTELTAKQIAQMEKDLEQKQELISKQFKKIEQSKEELDKNQKELNKNELNNEEKDLVSLIPLLKRIEEQGHSLDYPSKLKEFFDTGKIEVIAPFLKQVNVNISDEKEIINWGNLGEIGQKIKELLLEKTNLLTEIKETKQTIEQKNKEYDKEVKSKEDLIEELNTFAKYTNELYFAPYYFKDLDDKEKRKVIQISKRGSFRRIHLPWCSEKTDLSFLKEVKFFTSDRKANITISDQQKGKQIKEKRIILPNNLSEYFYKTIIKKYEDNLFFSDGETEISDTPLELTKSLELPSDTSEVFIIPKNVILNQQASFQFKVLGFKNGFPDASIRYITPMGKIIFKNRDVDCIVFKGSVWNKYNLHGKFEVGTHWCLESKFDLRGSLLYGKEINKVEEVSQVEFDD